LAPMRVTRGHLKYTGSSPLFQPALDLPGRVPAGDGLPLVPELLPLGQRQLHLGEAPAVEVDAQGDEGLPRLPALAQQPADLRLVEQELPGTGGLMVPAVAVLPGADVEVVEDHLAVLHLGEGLPQVGPPRPQRLDL